MKQYYFMKIYQVSEQIGYLKSGEKYYSMSIFRTPNEKYKLEVVSTLKRTESLIIVERISPFSVKEIKTGVKFPILNLKKKDEIVYISYPFGQLLHTFVISENGKLEATKVKNSQELEAYIEHTPDNKTFKTMLLQFINDGKTNMENKISEEILARQNECQNQTEQTNQQKQEKVRMKKLVHQIKQSRKSI